MKCKRMLSALLVLAMLLTCLPFPVLAAEAETMEETADLQVVNESGYFYFSAETADQLLIAPTKIAFTEGQTIRDALNASAYRFTTNSSSGFITGIEGVNGNFTYGSAPDGVTLDSAAGTATHFRFSEASDSTPSAGLQTLMQVMADYLEEDADVQNAAAKEYRAAVDGYLGVSDADAQSCAEAITDAITAYQTSQGTAYTVTFSGFSGSSYTVSAENAYGKKFTDSGHTGKLQLPAGSYTFSVRQDNRMVSGEITVSGAMTVTASLPTGSWFDESSLQISSGYDTDFAENCYTCTLQDHVATVQVPDSFTGRLYPYFALSDDGSGAAVKAIYTDKNGEAKEKTIPAKSQATSVDNALSRGAEGNTVILRAAKAGSDGYTQSMDLKLQLDRMPTLGSLRVTNSAGTAQAATEGFSSTTTEYTYKIVNTEKTLKIYPTATVSGSSITVNGEALAGDGSATVTISDETTVSIAVSSGTYTTTYTLTIQPGAGKKITFKTDSDVTLTVVNKNGEELAYTKTIGSGNTDNYLYTLVPGEDYSYVATKGTYYHAKKSFTLGSNTTIAVSVKEGDWLTALALGNTTNSKNKGNIALQADFSASAHAYTATVPDYSSTVYAWVETESDLSDSDQSYTCTAMYSTVTATSTDGTSKAVSLPAGKETGTYLQQALLPGSAYENTVTFRVSYTDKDDGVTYYTDYQVTLKRTLSLKNLEVSFQGTAVTLNRKNSSYTGFNRSEQSYSILVPAAATSLALTWELPTGSPRYGDTDQGYEITVNGSAASENGTFPVTLSGGKETETLSIVLTNRFNQAAGTVYTVEVQKADTTNVAFRLNPSDGQIYIYEGASGNRVWPEEDGTYALSDGFTYVCSFTCAGYVSQSGTMELASQDGAKVLKSGDTVYKDLSDVAITLPKAAENTSLQTDLESEWPDFRGDDSNNGVTSARTPVTAEDGMLYWAVKLGDGYSSAAVSSPILVDDCLIVYAGESLYRVNKDTGAVEATGKMAGKSSFAINSPTYADGIVLVGLSDGRIQAFNAVTLESLWLYTDPLGGQPNCPITVRNGYAYTGFWNSEEKDASFVCVSLTDEDPGSQQEAKAASWRLVQNGGFYWAGAYVCDDFVMVGTDDGKAGCSYVYLLDPMTGKVLDSRSGFSGDIRSTIAYDKVTDAYYFTSKKGSFYCIRVAQQDGSFAITQCSGLQLSNGATGPMSTSTPVIYNGRAYVGVCGTGQFTEYSGHNITVIDLESWSIAYSVPTQGYPQTSGLLTTAYEQETGYVYVYFFDNYTPGTLRVLRDKKGQTAADYLTQETYKGTSYQTPYAIFTPTGDQAQYAICSPIADSNGTIYFKNDSAYLMAFGRSIKKIEVTKQPDKTQYAVGETFDPTGMVVTATLSDGTTRDVTAMVSATTDALTEGTTEITLQLGRGQTMYRNAASGNKMTSGNTIAAITATVPIQVGDRTATGTLAEGITWSLKQPSDEITIFGTIPAGNRVLVAGYDANGKMTQAKILTQSGSVTLSGCEKIRIFYLGENYKPLCDAAAVLG